MDKWAGGWVERLTGNAVLGVGVRREGGGWDGGLFLGDPIGHEFEVVVAADQGADFFPPPPPIGEKTVGECFFIYPSSL